MEQPLFYKRTKQILNIKDHNIKYNSASNILKFSNFVLFIEIFLS